MTNAERLESFKALAPDWDSYGAKPIDPRAIEVARALVPFIRDGIQVFPMKDGGVLFETDDADIAISPDGVVAVESWEGFEP